jgi:LAO/AO transport system kinase
MRSIGSRGSYGGVSRSLRNIIRILDAAGYNLILIESVGAGQVQTEIARLVDITAVVFTPYTGDHIQNIKAGLTEVGDLCIVNKADLGGATTLYQSLLEYISHVIKVSAKAGKGIKELAEYIGLMVRQAGSSQREIEKKRLEFELRDMILRTIEQKVSSMLNKNSKYHVLIDRLARKKIDPYGAAEEVIRSLDW